MSAFAGDMRHMPTETTAGAGGGCRRHATMRFKKRYKLEGERALPAPPPNERGPLQREGAPLAGALAVSQMRVPHRAVRHVGSRALLPEQPWANGRCCREGDAPSLASSAADRVQRSVYPCLRVDCII